MRNTSWDDKKIEELLKRMPKVEDQRSPNEIYYQVQKRMRKEKRNYWFIPAAAVAAVLLLSFILYPSIFSKDNASYNTNEAQMDNAAMIKESNEDSGMEIQEFATDDAAQKDMAENDQKMFTSESLPTKSALYTDQLTANMTAITYAVPDQNIQNMIPITITVMQNNDLTWLDQYKMKYNQISFDEIGLDGDYLPYKGEVSIASDAAIELNLDTDHPYRNGSASETSIAASLDYSLKNTPYEKVIFSTNGEPGALFGNNGKVMEHIVNKNLKQAFFLYQATEESEVLLSPYGAKHYSTVQEAIEAMKEDIDTHDLQGPLKDFEIKSVIENESGITIEFGDKPIANTQENMLSMEAILLTAKNFGYKTVIFKHPNQEAFADFVFNEPVEVPMAPNYLEQYSDIER